MTFFFDILNPPPVLISLLILRSSNSSTAFFAYCSCNFLTAAIARFSVAYLRFFSSWAFSNCFLKRSSYFFIFISRCLRSFYFWISFFIICSFFRSYSVYFWATFFINSISNGEFSIFSPLYIRMLTTYNP